MKIRAECEGCEGSVYRGAPLHYFPILAARSMTEDPALCYSCWLEQKAEELWDDREDED